MSVLKQFRHMHLTTVWYATSIVRMCICVVAILRYFVSESWSQSDLFFWVLVQFNNKHRKPSQKKKKKNEWLNMPPLTKEKVIFDSKLSPGQFSVAEG